MRLQRLSSRISHEGKAFSTPAGRLHLGILVVCLVALVAVPDTEGSFLPECLGTVVAFECAVVSSRRGDGDAGALLTLRAHSFTVGAARLVARAVSVCAAACVVTFLLPVVVLLASPPQRDLLFVFPALVLAIMIARVMYLRVVVWRVRHRPPPGFLGRSVAAAAVLYEESCRILIPANARPAQLRASGRPTRVLALLVRATFALALVALAVFLAAEFFAIPALLPNSVSQEDLAAVTAQSEIVFPVTALVGVVLVDSLQWLRTWETDRELVATAHVVAVAVAVAVLGERLDDIVSWANSLASGLTGPSETAASVAVGAVFGVVGALFVDMASSLISAVVFLTRPHRGVTRRESLFGEEWDTVPAR